MLFYRASLDLSRRNLNRTARLISAHRRAIGSRWRRLTPAGQALLLLVHLRKGETLTAAAAGFAVGTATAWRYIRETTALLAACADSLEAVLRRARRRWGYVIIDGTLIACDRLAADRPFYSGKHKRHGMNIQVLAAPDGTLLWVSGALPGSVHDLKAARVCGLGRGDRVSGQGLQRCR